MNKDDEAAERLIPLLLQCIADKRHRLARDGKPENTPLVLYLGRRQYDVVKRYAEPSLLKNENRRNESFAGAKLVQVCKSGYIHIAEWSRK